MIFQDKQLQLEFDDIGYCKLNYNSIQELIAKYNETDINFVQGLNSSHFNNEYSFNKKINDLLFKISETFLNENFTGYQNILAHFLIKNKNTKDYFNLHQDWGIVNEELYQTLHIWIAHQDTNKENGTLFLLPKSHRILNNLRSGSIGIPFLELDYELKKNIHIINLRKGEVIVYNPAIFHGSFPNATNKSRIASLLAITDKNACLKYYHKNKDYTLNSQIDVFEITQKELLTDLKSLSKSIPPATKKIHSFKYNSYLPEQINTSLVVNKLNWIN